MTDKNPNFLSYYAIAQHYKFGIDSVFKADEKYDRIIILEEDLQVSNDFFDYFGKLSPLLDRDSSLFCISAWNDNGMSDFVQDSPKVYRSDFFPGLGWMMTRKLWEEDFGPKWPLGFWDDWIREGQNRRGRACIRPEISRTFTFGSVGGASSNQFSNFLSRIKLNSEKVDWEHFDINSLRKSNYDRNLIQEVNSATLVNSVAELLNKERRNENIRLIYSNSEEYLDIARQLGIMDDIKSGVPRGAYLGIVTVKWRSNTLHITTKSLKPVTYRNSSPYKL
ncbi:N-acetylglucosaminyltransferase I [Naegleria gruberi]|uniref:alpha-1,3-mannosyl-glycoprotein 2-beta-N-acetylglucosaminyltransferase n=1 Tax=Naegleria gruberi TaxID=5762 RepID=D2VLC2_NAEGR|nr:N-acetylglucosaminyltransferase I [Naegleria gruberi]EFC42285.1 N-acetylglucosaminyltransferase I [Naegleria gruberi]|eukprot:XP_002675029.1 N-acetylglucosaminyltransferase I [Naegleria gruberi strain NEG-M]